jgi:predicted alpha-1,6-mannanase (GH76 family)
MDKSRKQFKGIFMRYLSYLTIREKENKVAEKYKNFIIHNAEHLWKNRSKNNTFSYNWQTPDNTYDAITQSSAIDLFNAAARVSQI